MRALGTKIKLRKQSNQLLIYFNLVPILLFTHVIRIRRPTQSPNNIKSWQMAILIFSYDYMLTSSIMITVLH